MSYSEAYRIQLDHADAVLAARDSGSPEIGRLLIVEHDPVITISRRPGARRHLLASPETLATLGVAVEETDRGGDITYHGPGQLVAYPILDLNRLNLGLHAYMRLLESVIIDSCAHWGIEGTRDPKATGVWVCQNGRTAKIAAMGVRVRKWVSMHGLSLNVNPDMRHFDLIVPCGLAGRSVTSLHLAMSNTGRSAPTLLDAAQVVSDALRRAVAEAVRQAQVVRSIATDNPRQSD